jgi:hypothetical protein
LLLYHKVAISLKNMRVHVRQTMLLTGQCYRSVSK